jgi:hypothetical protein
MRTSRCILTRLDPIASKTKRNKYAAKDRQRPALRRIEYWALTTARTDYNNLQGVENLENRNIPTIYFVSKVSNDLFCIIHSVFCVAFQTYISALDCATITVTDQPRTQVHASMNKTSQGLHLGKLRKNELHHGLIHVEKSHVKGILLCCAVLPHSR